MCINQRSIVNRHYVKVAGSAARAEILFAGAPDLYLLVDCGRCLPCQKKRANYWRQRLLDEFNYYVQDCADNRYKVYFVTLTIAPQFYKKDISHVHDLFTKFRERYRKRFGCSLRFWCCTEYGEKRGRLHLHAIFFNPLFESTQLKDLWQYGRCDMSVVGCSLKNKEQDPLKGIAYVTKYITKTVDRWFIDWDQRSFCWCSPGLGKRYTLDPRNRKFHESKGLLFFRVDESGRFPQALPRYYISKLFSPLDILERSRVSISRLHAAPTFPVTVARRRFDDLPSYVSFLDSIGGKLNLLSSQFDCLSPEDQSFYLKHHLYEQSSF